MSGFHGAFATGVASQQGTLTLPDTWFRPPFWDLLMLQLLRPNSSNLPCLYSTFHLEYPLVLSRFYFIHKQTYHEQSGLNLDELIWYELALVWINSYTITPIHVIQVANNKLTQLRTNWLRTNWIKNESTCLWRQTRHSGPTYVFICPRSNIDFYMPAASNIYYRDYIERNLEGYNNSHYVCLHIPYTCDDDIMNLVPYLLIGSGEIGWGVPIVASFLLNEVYMKIRTPNSCCTDNR